MPPVKNNTLEKFIADSRSLVEKELDILVPAAAVEPKKLHQAIRWSVFAGGKRLRPALLMAAGKLYRAGTKKMLRTAAAIEMIHTYSLIHDDLPAMDDDDLRRGRQTCHKKFDEATAILAGDVLQTLAFGAVAADKRLSPEIRLKLISELSLAAGTPRGMVAGQTLDLAAERKPVKAADLQKIHALKTGALINAAVRCGAIIAGAKEGELKALSGYAVRLGQLFQITDDLLDVTAGAAAIGKTPGKDEKARKATYISLYGVEKTRNIAEGVYARACRELDGLGRPAALLRDLAGYVLRREK